MPGVNHIPAPPVADSRHIAPGSFVVTMTVEGERWTKSIGWRSDSRPTAPT